MAALPKPKARFGKPEKTNPTQAILTWGFVVIGVIGIIWMIAANPRQKNLNCTSAPTSSLTGFGSCTTE